MNGANKDAISKSISYIESRLLEDLDIDELAGQISFSKTHYQRLFHAIVGEPVMEYIKKRRLQQACQSLCQTNATVLEIALEYGYASHEGFTRAFKALYGMPPAQFRKKHASEPKQTVCEEVLEMLSNEVTQGIAQHTKTIADALAQFKLDLEKLCVSAEKAAIEVGQNGKGIIVVLGELKHLAAKVGAIIESVQGFTGKSQTAFEISDAIYALMRHVDELTFQAQLLQFFSGIEVARTGGMEVFTAFQNELTGLTKVLQKQHGNAINILTGLMSLLLADIQKESVRGIRHAIDLVDQTADSGNELTEKAMAIAIGAKPYGAGFMQIATALKMQTSEVKEVALLIGRYADTVEKEDAWMDSAPDKASLDRAVSSLKDTAFTVALIALHAAVEMARAREHNGLAGYDDAIREYATQIHQTYASCTELCNESAKLSSLLVKSKEEHPASISLRFQQLMDNIIFQGGLLTMQLGMESARAAMVMDDFVEHAKNAEDALALLSKMRCGDLPQDRDALSVYVSTVTALTMRCHADAEANGPRGVPFAFIAQAFDVFVEQMRAVLEKTKP